MLIERYDLEIFSPPCDPGAEGFAAYAHLTADISEVLPYLNAVLPGAEYHPGARALTWDDGEHFVAFHPRLIAIGDLADREAAVRAAERLIALVNDTWERRAGITPNYAGRLRPVPMALFKLLPQTNCRQCGEATCFNFALKLAGAHKPLAACAPLAEPQYAERLAALRALVGDLPAPQ